MVVSDALPNSLKDSNASPKMKIIEEGIGIRSFIRNTLGVKRVCWNSKMGTMMNDKWINYLYRFAQTKQQVG